jgi:ribosomal protein S8E
LIIVVVITVVMHSPYLDFWAARVINILNNDSSLQYLRTSFLIAVAVIKIIAFSDYEAFT